MIQGVVALLLAVGVFPFVTMYRAYVVIVLWGWFISPAFNVPAPSIYVAAGMMLTLHMAIPTQRDTKSDEGAVERILSAALIYGMVWPSIMLAFGWFWKWLQWGVA